MAVRKERRPAHAGQRPAPAHRARKLAREGADLGAGRDASKRAEAFQPVLAGRTATGSGAADAPGQLLRDAGRDAAGRAAAQRHVGITDGVQCLVPAAPAVAAAAGRPDAAASQASAVQPET